MGRPEFKVQAQHVSRVRPGVIVSTVVDAVAAQTVTFVADEAAHRHFRIAAVAYARPGRALEAHDRACSTVRHPSGGSRPRSVKVIPPGPPLAPLGGPAPRGVLGELPEDALAGLESRLAVLARGGSRRRGSAR